MKAYIYMIFNVVNGHHYVGSTNDLSVRFKYHRDCLNRSVHVNDYLQKAWNKYGKDSFQFFKIADVTDRTRLLIEAFFIKSFSCQYNLMRTTDHGNIGHSEETRKKMSLARRGRKCPRAWKYSDESKKKMSESQKIRFQINGVSEETRKKISVINKGKSVSEETKRKMSERRKAWWRKVKDEI